jgi:arylsulfatase A-like enzyme
VKLNPKSKTPNILFVVWDAVRFTHLSCYGYSRPTTPFLEKVFGEFVHFENAIAQSHWTLPSHASMFTGLYPSEHGALRSNPSIPEDIPILPELLRKAGYQMVGFSQNLYMGPRSGLDHGFDVFHDKQELYDRPSSKRNLAIRAAAKALRSLRLASDQWGYYWGSPHVVKSATRWINRARQPDRPFFMYINFMDAHIPCNPPPEYREKFVNFSLSQDEDWGTWKRSALAHEVSNKQSAYWVSLYDAAIAHLDSQFQRLYEFLDMEKLLDETLIILLSDHGENHGEHALFGHPPSLYDTILHVPLLIHFPNSQLNGSIYKPQVELLDIFPTLTEIAQIDNNYKHRGMSLLQLLSNPNPNRWAYAERFPLRDKEHRMLVRINPDLDTDWHLQSQKCIRTLAYKYIWSSNTRDEFYNLRDDPGESQNQIDEDIPEKLELKLTLEDWMAHLEERSPKKISQIDEDPAVLQRLADLGYLE